MTKMSLRINPYLFLAGLVVIVVGLLAMAIPAKAQTSDLTIIKTGPETAIAGQTISRYTITVANAGPDPITIPAGTVLVRDTLTNGTINSVSYSPSYDAEFVGSSPFSTVEFSPTIADVILAGDTRTFTVDANPVRESGTTITNTAIVDPNGAIAESNESNNTATATTTVLPDEADLALTKTDNPDPATVGEELTYTLTVTNNGPSYANPITIEDTLPAGVSLESAAISFSDPSRRGYACDEPTDDEAIASTGDQTTVTCLTWLAPGDVATVRIVVRPTVAGTLTNSATVQSNNDPVTSNNSATINTTVMTAPLPPPPAPQPEPQPKPQPPSGSQNASVRITGDGNDVSVDQSIEQTAFSPAVSTECRQQASGTQQCLGAVGYGDGNSATQQVE